jgi:nitroreductase
MNTTEAKRSTIEDLLDRHSVRNYRRNVSISDEQLNEILELTTSAPSSWNLQHWRFLVVRNQANKDQLLPLAYNQQQVSDASAIIIVLGDLQANLVAPKVFESAPPQVRESMLGQINGAYANNPELAHDEAIRNASLGAMQLMIVAKAKGYDTVPMGGYDKTAVKDLLNIPDRYVQIMMIALGKAETPGRATERLPIEDQTIHESF